VGRVREELREEAEEDPRAVLSAVEDSPRVPPTIDGSVGVGLAQRAHREVLVVVVDRRVDIGLHVGGGRFEKPEVFEHVVVELDGVVELVRGGHLEGVDAVDSGELPLGEVVVERAVGREVIPHADPRIVARAVAVEAESADVLDEDVDPRVGISASMRGRVAVGLGRAVAVLDDFLAPDEVHDRLHLVDPVRDVVLGIPVAKGRGVARTANPVDAEVREALVAEVALRGRVVVDPDVRIETRIRGPGEDRLGQTAIGGGELTSGRGEVAKKRRRTTRVDFPVKPIARIGELRAEDGKRPLQCDFGLGQCSTSVLAPPARRSYGRERSEDEKSQNPAPPHVLDISIWA
jgi:hypothetical protein